MPKSLREQLEESFDVEKEAGGPAEDTEESVGLAEEENFEEEEENLGEAIRKAAEGDEESVPSGEETGELDELPEPEGEEKGEDDKSVPSKSSDSADDATSQAASEEEVGRAPQSWKPGVREHWNKLPNEVRQEVLRRESEISRGLQQAAGHRKLAEEYVSVIKPYETLIRAQNSTPSQAIGNMMQTAARLTMGTPQQKAQVLGEIVQNYAVDVEMLDSVLAGIDLPESADDPLMQKIDQRLQPLTQFVNQFHQSQATDQRQLETQVNTTIQEFANNPRNEFYEDVRQDMADLMELAAKRGKDLSLEKAYELACSNDPEISKVIQHREAAARARPSGDDLRRKRRAASSIPSDGPTGAQPKGENMSLRGVLEQAFEDSDDRI